MVLEQLHTDSNQVTDDSNKIKVQFQAIMVPTSDLTTATDYYLSAGAEYGNEAGLLGIEAVTNEVGHGRFAELA